MARDPDTEYAGVVTRTIALALDALLIDAAALAVSGAVLLVMSVFSISGKHNTILVVLGSLVFAAWAISYFAVFWTTTGQTIGSRVMEIKVVRCDGSRLKPRHALVRLAGMVISLPLFWGYIPILTSARRRGVFDVMAGTEVSVFARPEVTHQHPPPPVSPQGEAARFTEPRLLP